MKDIFKAGDEKSLTYQVKAEDVAAFEGRVVHEVCSTFSLAREIEWATRQYILEMKDEDEEGIGTLLEITHLGPAFVGEQILINSRIESLERNELICGFMVKVGDRLIAKGRTGQKLLKKEKIHSIFSNLRK